MNSETANQLERAIDDALARGDHDQADVLARRYRADAGSEGEGIASPRFRSRYLSAQVALAAGRLREAVGHLAGLMPLPGGLPDALACRIWLLSAEALARLHRTSEARGHLDRAMRFPECLEDNPLLTLRAVRTRLWLGDVAVLNGEVDRCDRALAALGDASNRTLLRCEEGRAWDHAGRLDRARGCWHEADLLSRGLGADPDRADVLIQLGRLAHLEGSLQEALDRYDASIALSPVPLQRLEARLRRLLVLLDLNQAATVRGELDRLLPPDGPALPEEIEPLAAMLRCLVYESGEEHLSNEARGYQAAQRTDLQAARQLYRSAMEESPAPARQARLALALGMLAVALQDAVDARHWLARCEELARTHRLAEVLWRCLQARGQLAAELEGDDESARALFEEAVLVSEGQQATLKHRADAAAHGLRRAEILQRLLSAACRRGDPAAVFRYQETQRGRLLLELWRAAPSRPGQARLADHPDLSAIDAQIADCASMLAGPTKDRAPFQRRYQELLLQRDRLFDAWLRDRSRVSAAVPPLPDLADLEGALPAGTLYLAPVLVDDSFHLLVVRRGRKARLVSSSTSAIPLREAMTTLRNCLDAQLDRYRHGFMPGNPERRTLDACLDAVGICCLGDVLWRVLDEESNGLQRLVWVPDGPLHGLPLHAVRRGGRYLVETIPCASTFSGAMLVHHSRTRPRRSWWLRALVLSESPEVLPAAAAECAGVAATFAFTRFLQGEQATRATLRRRLGRVSVAHLACHAYFDPEHPLSAHIGLPSGETWHALEWLEEPVDGLPLVTLSACRSAEVAPLVGREVFGLATGLLAAGVRSVLASLWPLPDRETQPFMWRFYRHRMLHDVTMALALAQRESLAAPDGSPLFWAAFALCGDPDPLPAPGRWIRWLIHWRQRRHARRFPLTNQPTVRERV